MAGTGQSPGEAWVRTLFPGAEAQRAFDDLLAAVRRHDAVFAATRATSFDHAATAAPTPLSLAAAALANLALPANANSVHQSGIAAQEMAAQVRGELARMLLPRAQADRDCVAFTDGGSAANDLALASLPPRPKRLSGGRWRDVVLVGALEHPSLASRAATAEVRGYKVVFFPSGADGVYDTAAFEALVREHGDGVAFMSAHLVNNEVGTLQPVAQLTALLRQHCPGAVSHVDCVQAFGREPVDMAALGCDLLSLAFHKIGGPKRKGALVAAKATALPRRFRDTPDIGTAIASVAAAKDALAAMDATRARCQALRQRLSSAALAACGRLGVVAREAAPAERCVPGILTLLFPGLQGRHLVTMLGDAGFDLSAGAACAAQNDGPSHVLQAMHIDRQDCYSALRLSFGLGTTDADADRMVGALCSALERLLPVQQRELRQRQFKSDAPPPPREHELQRRRREQGRKRKSGSPASDAGGGRRVRSRQDGGGLESLSAAAGRALGGLAALQSSREAAHAAAAAPPAAAPQPAGAPPRADAGAWAYDAVMICLGETVLKGANRAHFEKQLIKNIKSKLAEDEAARELYLWTPAGHPHAGFLLLLYLSEEDKPRGGPSQCPKLTVPRPCRGIPPPAFEGLTALLREVSGIASFAPVLLARPEWAHIREQGLRLFRHSLASLDAEGDGGQVTFGVAARRVKDTRGGGLAMPSEQIQRELGGDIMDAAAAEGRKLTVDLKQPALMFEVRSRTDCAILFCRRDRVAEAGGGGLPDGSDGDGRVLCLLSGGHDSPVAAHKVMGRGCRVAFVHFDGYPFTGAEIVDKVRRLQEILNRFQGKPQMLLVVPFSKVQEVIANARGVCASYRTVLYRVFFFRMACRLAQQWRFRALCTGDNLGQVASQTLANMAALDRESELMVLRPLLTWTKREILDHAKRIGTEETSSLHGTVDCCTVFKPCNPVLHIDPKHMATQLARLSEAGIDAVVDEALRSVRIYRGGSGADGAASAAPAAAAGAAAAPAAAAGAMGAEGPAADDGALPSAAASAPAPSAGS